VNILANIDELQPAVVITSMMRPKALARPTCWPGEPQVIFCGVNAPCNVRFSGQKRSGVRERWHFRGKLALLRKVLSKARRVELLTDMSESSGFVLEGHGRRARQGGPFAVTTARCAARTPSAVAASGARRPE
jgi:hypothetical protein